MEGLLGWFVKQTEARMKEPKADRRVIIQMTRYTFKELFSLINIKDWNKPMTWKKADQH